MQIICIYIRYGKHLNDLDMPFQTHKTEKKVFKRIKIS